MKSNAVTPESSVCVRRMSGRKISYDTPKPGMSSKVGALSVPKSWKFMVQILMSTDKLSFGLIFEKAAIVLLLLVHRLLLPHYDFFLYLDRGGRNLLKLEVKTELLCATLIFHI